MGSMEGQTLVVPPPEKLVLVSTFPTKRRDNSIQSDAT